MIALQDMMVIHKERYTSNMVKVEPLLKFETQALIAKYAWRTTVVYKGFQRQSPAVAGTQALQGECVKRMVCSTRIGDLNSGSCLTGGGPE